MKSPLSMIAAALALGALGGMSPGVAHATDLSQKVYTCVVTAPSTLQRKIRCSNSEDRTEWFVILGHWPSMAALDKAPAARVGTYEGCTLRDPKNHFSLDCPTPSSAVAPSR